jgi:hypothetical protein
VGLSPVEQGVLQKWKSIRRLYAFLENELRRINRECFRGRLPLPTVQLMRMKYSWDILGEGYVGAFYLPDCGDRPAQIGIYPLVLTSAEDARLALAHEMVHHWEWHHRHQPAQAICPPPAHFLVRRQFPSVEKQYHWRLAHSFRFMAKSGDVARILGISLNDFLFKNLKTPPLALR